VPRLSTTLSALLGLSHCQARVTNCAICPPRRLPPNTLPYQNTKAHFPTLLGNGPSAIHNTNRVAGERIPNAHDPRRIFVTWNC
ncbi:hypothetical protein SISSUDRAFT_1047545, partial [Sistotremastrum suecicum HHB10207 ss-3]